MGRPRQFDPDTAVTDAMEAFWDLGYEGASAAVLEEHMGIGRSSLYATFGSKDELYAAAMDRYLEDLRKRVITGLRADGPALDVLQSFFHRVTRRGEPGGEPLRCCMIVRSCATGTTASPAIARLVERAIAELDDAFHDLLLRARHEGTLRARGSLRGLARLLTTTFQGLNIAANAGRSRRELQSITRATLDLLEA
ncbi:MAG: TetR/AcrR family transcriptional regulator [Phycisphaerales bacterium]|nr:TetR/AcrR family transcriptional regulator [Phycisphaerae bacterium]NNF42531.1 TetR/AcrR family transcriptional regulator [Phycisphaerales bacterium]NNM25221.1 TetR/AcrR family transcriptional regulator [Phycisphaerales bacterium]